MFTLAVVRVVKSILQQKSSILQETFFPPERFHVVSTWNTRGVFVRKYLNSLCFYFYKWFQDLVVTFSINCLLWNLLNDCSTESCEKYYLNPRILRPWLSSIILEHKSNQKLSGLEKKKIPISRIFLEHSLLYILIITTISMKINFTWTESVMFVNIYLIYEHVLA